MYAARRRWLLVIAGGLALQAARSAPARPVRRIELIASRFSFSMAEIRATKGEAITIALSSPDFPHGFAIPELGVRADAMPGRIVEVVVVADRPGRFQYLCDNFCGEGHDRMFGLLVVGESGS